MNYGEVRDAALNLAHQATIAGEVIPGTYNNQQDYLNKIPELVNAAQMDIATTAKFIPEAAMLGSLSYKEMGASRLYRLPADLWQRGGSGLLVPRGRRYDGQTVYERFGAIRMVGRDQMIVPASLPEDTIIEYYRYPYRLPAKPNDRDELDNVPEVHPIIPYYVAAHLVITDDAFLYASFYNEYEAKKSRLQELVHAEPGLVEDVVLGDIYSVGW